MIHVYTHENRTIPIVTEIKVSEFRHLQVHEKMQETYSVMEYA